jgi:hypothetical protein
MTDYLVSKIKQLPLRAFALVTGISLFAVMVTPTLGLAHGGGLDAQGCHMNRSTGVYHCHRGGSVSSGMGNVREPATKARRAKTKRVYRPIRANFEAEPYRPAVSRSDGICACSRQARCTGPRGGVYCVNGSGNKRYIGQ